ncbi:hypothetical protein GCM10008021_31640 [Deinococcus wulumuqiensis]|uniref:Secreted protein n=1 Tax=Deinococcus wulumuqiensis TaxID=980427 RepID=A0ABQ2C8Z1_9DEIO|nr:hypothetical protein GCM10008021_31640 [Deinococcus wulumuqiensis]
MSILLPTVTVFWASAVGRSSRAERVSSRFMGASGEQGEGGRAGKPVYPSPPRPLTVSGAAHCRPG